MSDSEDEVRTLQDPEMYTKSIPKDRVTHTVRGLTPDVLRDERRAEPFDSPAAFPSPRRARCARRLFDCLPALWLPLLFGALSVAARAALLPSPPLQFPARAGELRRFVSSPGERAADFAARTAALWAPSALAALFALSLAAAAAAAARHFAALCGVGVAALAIAATGAQIALLRFACAWSRSGACDVPFGLYWTFGVAREGAPPLAVWCAAIAIDAMRFRGPALSTLVAVPLLGFAAAAVMSLWSTQQAVDVLVLCTHATTVVWMALLFVCARIPRFDFVYEVKGHMD